MAFKRNKNKSKEPILVELQCSECKTVYKDYTYGNNPHRYPRCPRCGSSNVLNTYWASSEGMKSMQSFEKWFFIIWGGIILLIIVIVYFLISWLFF